MCPVAIFAAPLLAVLSGAPPQLAANGIRNAAAQIPTSLPAARLAPGSRISLTGIRLAPQPRVTLRAGARDFPLTILSAEPARIEAVIPAGVPPGAAALKVTVGGEDSPGYALSIAAAAPGLFTRNGRGWGPADAPPTRPGAIVIVPATGIGRTPPRAFVGNIAVNTTVARQRGGGIVELRIPIPSAAPTGCNVPLQLETAAIPTNTVTLTIAPCDPRNPAAPAAEIGRSYGFAIRTGTPATGATDVWAGFFQLTDERQAGPLLRLPPPGSCLAATFAADEDTPLGASLPALLLRGQPRILPAGPHLNLFAGNRTLRIPAGDSPVYQRKLPPPLPPGELMLSGQGSDRVGPFSVRASDPLPLASVSLPADRSRVARSQPLSLSWQPDGADHPLLVALLVRDPGSMLQGFVLCRTASAQRYLRIDSRWLTALPATAPGAPPATLLIASLPPQLTPFRAAQLDQGYYVPAALYSTTVLLE